jgi:hypothetical protein
VKSFGRSKAPVKGLQLSLRENTDASKSTQAKIVEMMPQSG